MPGIAAEANVCNRKKGDCPWNHERFFHRKSEWFGNGKTLEKKRFFMKKSVDKGEGDVIFYPSAREKAPLRRRERKAGAGILKTIQSKEEKRQLILK